MSMAQIVSTENCNQTSLTYYASLTYEVSKDSRMKIIYFLDIKKREIQWFTNIHLPLSEDQDWV